MGQPKKKERPSLAADEAQAPEPVAPQGALVTFHRDAPLPRYVWALLAGLVVVINLPVIHHSLLRSLPAATVALPYQDDFSNPATVAEHFWSSGGHWRVVNGELLSPGVKNNPLWLKASLPADVAVEFDARSESPQGDIKVELFGDGSDHASGYVFIHGGWNNSLSIIARLDEHGTPLSQLQLRAGGEDLVKSGVFAADTHMRVEANPYPVQPGRTYRWRIERRGSQLRWFIDGQLFMEFDDPLPLRGPGHDRFGFSSWEAQLFFDNLKVEPL